MDKYYKIKEECLKANLKIPEHKLAIYTFGNVSVYDKNLGVVAIKPSGVPYHELDIDQIVLTDLEGRPLSSNSLNPSSDTKTHCYLYKSWPSIKSICHTHSTYAVGWSQSLQDVEILGTTHADHLTRSIPCTPPMRDDLIKGDYELNTGIQIVEYFKEKNINPHEVQMLLVGSHGPFTWGESAEQSVYNSKVLEEICQMALISKTINPNVKRLKQALIKKHYERKHGDNSYYGQS